MQFRFQYVQNIRHPSFVFVILNTTTKDFKKIELSLSLEGREGWYGDNCRHQCLGQCRDNTTCNHVTRQCARGCAAGWTGTLGDRGLFVCFTIQNQITNHFYSKLDDDYLSKIALSFRDRHSQFQFYE